MDPNLTSDQLPNHPSNHRENRRPNRRQRRAQAWVLTAAAATGLALGAAGIAGAATDSSSSSSTSSASTATPAADAARPDPASLPNGPNETLLTGDTATKVTAAALDAVPGGTIIRVETDSNGSPYEAHVKKADGTTVTVLVGSDFTVTSTIDGFGPGGPGGPHGQPPAQSQSTTTAQ